MPSRTTGRWAVPEFVRVSVVVLGALGTALAPLFLALWLADSYGWERENARSVAFLVTMALFGVWCVVLRKLAQRQARREWGEELDRRLAPYRDEDGG